MAEKENQKLMEQISSLAGKFLSPRPRINHCSELPQTLDVQLTNVLCYRSDKPSKKPKYWYLLDCLVHLQPIPMYDPPIFRYAQA